MPCHRPEDRRGGDVQEADSAVPRPGGEQAAIVPGKPDDRKYISFVRRFQSVESLALHTIPYYHSFIIRSTCQIASSRTPLNAIDTTSVALQFPAEAEPGDHVA